MCTRLAQCLFNKNFALYWNTAGFAILPKVQIIILSSLTLTYVNQMSAMQFVATRHACLITAPFGNGFMCHVLLIIININIFMNYFSILVISCFKYAKSYHVSLDLLSILQVFYLLFIYMVSRVPNILIAY